MRYGMKSQMKKTQCKILSLVMVMAMSLGLAACKSEYSSKIGDVKSALQSKCKAEKADVQKYKLMVDTQFSVEEIKDEFTVGVYCDVDSKDMTFFGFHSVVDVRKVNAAFKYLKTDPANEASGLVPTMEVLVIQFTDKDTAANYYESIQNQHKQTYQDNTTLDVDMFNEYISKNDYFAFASETENMSFNVYAQIDGKTVMYAYVEGPTSETLKADYESFMQQMECSIIKH